MKACLQYVVRAVSTAVLAGFGLAGCKQHAAPADADLPKVNLKVETVYARPLTDTLDLPGRVEADPVHLVHVYAPLSGRLLSMTLTPGQEVRKGQAVAVLQSGDVAQARADFDKARIESLRADHALDRGKLLVAHEVMSQAEFQDLQATDQAAHTEGERARQRIRELGFSENGTTDTTTVVAPIAGTVLEIGTAQGELQRSLETTTGIATIANLDTVWVTGDLFERDLSAVHVGESVDVAVSAYPGQLLHGTVANIGDSLDPGTHALKVRVVLVNPGHRLKPEMFATLRIARASAPRIVVPQTAVLHEGDVTEVYVPSGKGKYDLRRVTTGALHGENIEILAGLGDGEQIVTQGAAFLREPVGD